MNYFRVLKFSLKMTTLTPSHLLTSSWLEPDALERGPLAGSKLVV
jgi:hypothetical protein